MNKEIKYKYKLDLKEETEKQREGKIGIGELSKKIANRLNKLEVAETDDKDGLDGINERLTEVESIEDYDNAMNELIDWCERWEDEGMGTMVYRCKLSIKDIKAGEMEKPKEMLVLGVKRDEYDSEWFHLFLSGQTLRIDNENVKWEIKSGQSSPVALVSKERERYYGRKFHWVTKVTIKGEEEGIKTLLYNIGVGSADKEVEPKWRKKGEFEV